MIWVVLLILALIAFFGYKGLHTKHVSRCRYDERTTEHVPDAINEQQSHKEFHEQHATAPAQLSDDMPVERVPPQRGGPSLLYAERAETIPSDAMESSNSNWQDQQDALDFTAETATLSSDEVGMPANSSDYEQLEDNAEDTIDRGADNVYETVDAVSDTHHASLDTSVGDISRETVYESPDKHSDSVHGTSIGSSSSIASNESNARNHAGIAAAGVAAAAAGIGIASTAQSATSHDQVSQDQVSQDSLAQHKAAQYTESADHIEDSDSTVSVEGIDLELGDTTLNDVDDIDDNDELLDFGDLTADISEMLKELNLRETDSPRLEINQEEFQQLKTGEPGEVKHEKIENVAGKLRNMLQ